MTSKQQVDNDGFVTVEKKFKYMSLGGNNNNNNNNKRTKNKKKGRYYFKDSDDYTLEDVESILSQKR